jgi:hypothetical protein
MSLKNIYKHLDKMSMIVRQKITEPRKSKDHPQSKKAHIRYNLTRYKI